MSPRIEEVGEMIRSKTLEFTHLGRRILVFPVGEDGTESMLAVDGAIYGPFPTRRAALAGAHGLVDARAYELAS
jgi:hypothetical protein